MTRNRSRPVHYCGPVVGNPNSRRRPDDVLSTYKPGPHPWRSQRMEQKKRAKKSRCQPVDQTRTKPNLDPHLEVFAKAVAEGFSHVEAAEICGRKPGSASFLYRQPGVQERIAELRSLAKYATEK